MSDAAVASMVNAVVGLLGTGIAGYIAYKMTALQQQGRQAEMRAQVDRREVAAKVEAATAQAAHEVRQVKQTLAESVSTTVDKLDAIHVLVNERYAKALDRIYKLALKVVEGDDTPENRAEVDQARKEMLDHDAQQKIVDQRPPP